MRWFIALRFQFDTFFKFIDRLQNFLMFCIIRRYGHNCFLNVFFHLQVAGHPIIGPVDAGQYGLAQRIG
jgi:hypothetical protein